RRLKKRMARAIRPSGAVWKSVQMSRNCSSAIPVTPMQWTAYPCCRAASAKTMGKRPAAASRPTRPVVFCLVIFRDVESMVSRGCRQAGQFFVPGRGSDLCELRAEFLQFVLESPQLLPHFRKLLHGHHNAVLLLRRPGGIPVVLGSIGDRAEHTGLASH